MRNCLFICCALLWFGAAHGLLPELDAPVMCEAASDQIPESFSGPTCKKTDRLDPQGRMIWVEMTVLAGSEMMSGDEPLGLFVSGKAATRAYLNGQLIGANGKPTQHRDAEVAGLIDWVGYIPSGLLKPGDNKLHLLMSAHQGWLNLAHPIQFVSINQYQRPADSIFRHYWPTLLVFGVLLFGALYWGFWAWLNQRSIQQLMIPLMSGFVLIQLLVEVSRGLVSYPYPWQDLRLLMILACSLGFGLSLLLYVMMLLKVKLVWLWPPLLLTITLVLLLPGFDLKTALAIMLPAVVAILVALKHWQQGNRSARFFWVVLLVFVVVLVSMGHSSFIDVYYYYLVAMLLLTLMGQQLLQFAAAQKQQQADQQRAKQLQLIIEQQQMLEEDPVLQVSGVGELRQVKVNDIAYCRGAGDYVELVLANDEVVMHHSSLSELINNLSSVFLKTHRSYLVNTQKIQSLSRTASGVGQLHLETGQTVPVSRRILPQLREQLKTKGA